MKRIFLLPVLLAAAPLTAMADDFTLYPDNLTFFQEPNNFSTPLGTLRTNARLDESYLHNFSSDRTTYQTEFFGRANLEQQTANYTTVGAQVDTHYFRVPLGKENWRQQVQAYARDDWGFLAIGSVSQGVRQDTKRRAGIGHAQLALDDFYGNLDQDAVYYRYNSRAYTSSVAVDREGHAEVGFAVSQPMDESLYKLSWRARRGDTTDRDLYDAIPTAAMQGRDPATSYGTAVVGSYTYGSFTADVQLGYERLNLKLSPVEKNRTFVSDGVYYKIGVFSLSAETMVGEYGGRSEFSSAVGGRVDLARGLFVNLGHNYAYYDSGNATTNRSANHSLFFLSTCYDF